MPHTPPSIHDPRAVDRVALALAVHRGQRWVYDDHVEATGKGLVPSASAQSLFAEARAVIEGAGEGIALTGMALARDGWEPFGTHANDHIDVEIHPDHDETGMPLWERAIPVTSPTVTAATFAPEIDPETGYPTDAALDALVRFEGTPGEFFAAARALWNYPQSARAESGCDAIDRPGITYTFVTLGWSGNESVIGAMRATLFWTSFWTKSERGGLFEFHVPDTQAGLRFPAILTPDQADGVHAHEDLTDLRGRLHALADGWDRRAVAHPDDDPDHEPDTADWYAPAFAAELREVVERA